MTHPLIPLLDAAVQQHLWDDRPVGINVSGGLDSSTVACLAKRWRDTPMFTGWYDAAGFDERRYARMAAGADHHEIRINPGDFVANFDDMMAAFTPPYQGPGMFGQYMVAKYIYEATDVQVVLSGEGSDELFGGYARLMAVAGADMPDGYENYRPPADYPDNLRDALDYDYERLPDLLKVDDEALGAFGLEARAPFTSQAVVKYGLALNPRERVGKQHLRQAVRGLVPDPIIDRTDKCGFPIPLVAWANTPGSDVGALIQERIGYLPDPARPFDRGWWADLCQSAAKPVAA